MVPRESSYRPVPVCRQSIMRAKVIQATWPRVNSNLWRGDTGASVSHTGISGSSFEHHKRTSMDIKLDFRVACLPVLVQH